MAIPAGAEAEPVKICEIRFSCGDPLTNQWKSIPIIREVVNNKVDPRMPPEIQADHDAKCTQIIHGIAISFNSSFG